MDRDRNPVVWFEIPTGDLERAKKFYEYIFGVQLSLHDFGELRMAWFPSSSGGRGSAGCLIHHAAYTPSHAGTMVYIHVSSIDDTLARIRESGNKIINGKTQIGDFGYVAHFEDTEGNRVALHEDL